MACCRVGLGAAVSEVRHAAAFGKRKSSLAPLHQRFGGLKCRSFLGINLASLLPSNGTRWSATWLDSSAQVDVDVPLAFAWELWSDREGINRWMPWISSIKVLENDPALSRWTLKTEALGQNFEFSWMARNFEPIYHQKIHWRSIDGLPNRGAVRFYPRGPSSCRVQLTISYEVPAVLSGIASSALSPLVESILKNDMERFAELAVESMNTTKQEAQEQVK